MSAYKKDDTVFLKGKIKWCKHLIPDPTFNKYSVVMYVVGDELEKVRQWQAMGIKNKVSMDDDGWYITLSRKTSITVKGREVGLVPPVVIDKDGKPIETAIGNGSDGVAECILWSSRNYPGKNLRWQGLRIDNRVEYHPSKDLIDGGKSIEDLRREPAEALF